MTGPAYPNNASAGRRSDARIKLTADIPGFAESILAVRIN